MCLVRRIITCSVQLCEELDLDLVILYDDDVFLNTNRNLTIYAISHGNVALNASVSNGIPILAMTQRLQL